MNRGANRVLLKLQANHQVKDRKRIQTCESRQRFSRQGKFASWKSEFKKPANFIIFSILSKKVAIILFVENWKWTRPWPLLLFVINFSVLFACVLFLGDFRWICWAGHNIKRFQSSSVGSAECLSMRWRPSDLSLFLLKFLQNLKQKKKVADCWVETSRVEQDLPRPALKNS